MLGVDFEVFLDGNIWQQGESAGIAQYATIPEPSSLLLTAFGLAGLAFGRSQRRKRGRIPKAS